MRFNWTRDRLDELEANLPPLIRDMDFEKCPYGHTRYELLGLVYAGSPLEFAFVKKNGECRRCAQERGRNTKRRNK